MWYGSLGFFPACVYMLYIWCIYVCVYTCYTYGVYVHVYVPEYGGQGSALKQ